MHCAYATFSAFQILVEHGLLVNKSIVRLSQRGQLLFDVAEDNGHIAPTTEEDLLELRIRQTTLSARTLSPCRGRVVCSSFGWD